MKRFVYTDHKTINNKYTSKKENIICLTLDIVPYFGCMNLYTGFNITHILEFGIYKWYWQYPTALKKYKVELKKCQFVLYSLMEQNNEFL